METNFESASLNILKTIPLFTSLSLLCFFFHCCVLLLLFSYHATEHATPWTTALQASLSFTSSQSLLKLMSVESVMLSNHLILCRPLLLLPSIFPSIKVFSNKSSLRIRWPKYWSLGFSISPSNIQYQSISFQYQSFLNIQGWFPLGLMGLFSLQSRDSQEPFPEEQYESINSLALSILYGQL